MSEQPRSALSGARWRAFLPLGIGVALLALTAGVFVSVAARIVESLEEESRIAQRMRRLEDVQTMLQDAEVGQRGYLLTGRIADLEPYHTTLSEIDQRLAQLRELYAGDVQALARIDELQWLKDEKYREIRRTVRLRQNGDTAQALRILQSPQSQQASRAMRALIGGLAEEARATGARYDRWIAAWVGRAESALLVVTALLILVVAISARAVTIAVRKDAELRMQLERAAHHDVLTGLPNRRFVDSWLPYALSQARRESRRLAVLYLDLDGFKAVNDRYGHAAGDRLLVRAAQRFAAIMRKSDVLARVGGDEFVVFIPNAPAREQLAELAGRLAEALAAPDGRAGELEPYLHTGVSIGIAVFPEDAADEQGLLAAADAAMYADKRRRRDQLSLFEPGGETPANVVALRK